MTLNIAGHLVDFDTPQIMGIINVTPDSFYAASRTPLPTSAPQGACLSADEEAMPAALLQRAGEMVAQGAAILDIGACSTRPDALPAGPEEELRRLDAALTALEPLRARHPDVIISIDTFRAAVARHCLEHHGVHLINDVSAGLLDPEMFQTVADFRVPYVLTHSGGLASTPVPGRHSGSAEHAAGAAAEGSAEPRSAQATVADDFLPSVARFFAERLQQLYALGVADVILDPGFGFGKTMAENYALLHHLGDFVRLFPDNPLLVGVSRKSMICRLLGITPGEALNGTTVLHTLALQAGAHILRVHDVRPAAEAVSLCLAAAASSPASLGACQPNGAPLSPPTDHCAPLDAVRQPE